MKDILENLKSEAINLIQAAGDPQELEKLRVRFLGKKGELTDILKRLGALSAELRPAMGQLANDVKRDILESLEGEIHRIRERQMEEDMLKSSIDITLPGRPVRPGSMHPVTRITREIEDIFAGMGFQVVEGPEVEEEYYNFEALNIPPDHPSREMWDSFYMGEGLLLRSHTSPVQVRVMEKTRPPVKVIVPGKCYRRDAVDPTHHWNFHQVEGLLVDDRVTFADLKGILLDFARRMFGQERKAKFIPSYFPFTEPSAEMAIDCFVCSGKGCRVCKQSGWIEILGSGMVNPRVLEFVGYSPEEFTGFAFGMGIDRIALLKYGINDIRLLLENDIRFLEQF